MSRIRDTIILIAFGCVLVILCALTMVMRFGVDLWTIWKPRSKP